VTIASDGHEATVSNAPRKVTVDLAEQSFRLGRRLEAEADTSRAQAAYRLAERHGHGDAAFRLGMLLEAQGKIDAAKAAYRRADRRGHGPAAYRRGVLLAQRGEIGGAKAAFRRAEQRGAGAGTPLATLTAPRAEPSPQVLKQGRRSVWIGNPRRLLLLGLPPYLAVLALLAASFAGRGGSSQQVARLGRHAVAARVASAPADAPALPPLPRLLPHAVWIHATVRHRAEAPSDRRSARSRSGSTRPPRRRPSVTSVVNVVASVPGTPSSAQTSPTGGYANPTGGYANPTVVGPASGPIASPPPRNPETPPSVSTEPSPSMTGSGRTQPGEGASGAGTSSSGTGIISGGG
jgi:hypothetical protein